MYSGTRYNLSTRFSLTLIYLYIIYIYIYCTISAFPLYGEHVVRSFLPDGIFFYIVTTGWIFDIILLCENSINQSIKFHAGTFNTPTSYQQWVWEREAHINWSMVTCQGGSTRSELS